MRFAQLEADRFAANCYAHSAMQITVEPPIASWCFTLRDDAARSAAQRSVNQTAERLHTPQLISTSPLIATGHQAWLWHPGILAKHIAAKIAAEKENGQPLNLIVDTDAHEGLRVELPIIDDQRLSVEIVDLADSDRAIPTCCQPPVDSFTVLARLREIDARLAGRMIVDLAPLVEAWTDLPSCHTLAEQITVALDRLTRPHIGDQPKLFASELIHFKEIRSTVTALRDDPLAAARSYNEATSCVPNSQVIPLTLTARRVELPLWWMQWRKPRQRVYADLSNGQSRLVLDSGQPVDIEPSSKRGRLALRALLLTAMMRSHLCDCFIHGTGGAVYDRVMEAWWESWRGETLAPKVVVTADVKLNFDVPVADRKEIDQAAWWAHHLPHNIDRVLKLDGPQVESKRQLLANMNDDHDRIRRSAAFAKIHQINNSLAKEHRDVIDKSLRRLSEAKIGQANQRIAYRRDWCFALHPPSQIRDLIQAIKAQGR